MLRDNEGEAVAQLVTIKLGQLLFRQPEEVIPPLALWSSALCSWLIVQLRAMLASVTSVAELARAGRSSGPIGSNSLSGLDAAIARFERFIGNVSDVALLLCNHVTASGLQFLHSVVSIAARMAL